METPSSFQTGTKDCNEHRAGGTVRSQLRLFCATSGRNRHSSTVGGILASITEAEIRVAIQAHLQEEAEKEGGREGGMRESRSMKGGGGVLHAHTV